MRLIAVVLVVLAAPVEAGPAVMPEIIGTGTTAVVVVTGPEGGESQLATDVLPPALEECEPVHGRRWRPEGCVLERARITAETGATLVVGARYLARLEPAGGAQCSTTVRATALFPLRLFPAIERLLGARGALGP